jgi:hypothetical protein
MMEAGASNPILLSAHASHDFPDRVVPLMLGLPQRYDSPGHLGDRNHICELVWWGAIQDQKFALALQIRAQSGKSSVGRKFRRIRSNRVSQ